MPDSKLNGMLMAGKDGGDTCLDRAGRPLSPPAYRTPLLHNSARFRAPGSPDAFVKHTSVCQSSIQNIAES